MIWMFLMQALFAVTGRHITKFDYAAATEPLAGDLGIERAALPPLVLLYVLFVQLRVVTPDVPWVECVTSKDGFFKRMRVLLRIVFSAKAFGALVEGQAFRMAQAMATEMVAQYEADKKVADLEHKAQVKRSTKRGR